MGLLVTCDQLPSPTADISVFSTSLGLCTEWDPLGVVMGAMCLVLLIRSKVVRLEKPLAPASSQGPTPESSSDLWLLPFSLGDKAEQEEMGSDRVQSLC